MMVRPNAVFASLLNRVRSDCACGIRQDRQTTRRVWPIFNMAWVIGAVVRLKTNGVLHTLYYFVENNIANSNNQDMSLTH